MSRKYDFTNAVNQVVSACSVGDINKYLIPESCSDKSPIDIFYEKIKSILKLGTVDFLKTNEVLGASLFLGIISSTDNYFRSIFSKTLSICPYSKAISSEKKTALGSILWHSNNDLLKGVFEFNSFTSSKIIGNTTQNYFGFDLSKTSINTVISEYEKLCELRHCIVHSDSMLSGKNALRLNVESCKTNYKIIVNFAQLQECCAICTKLVTSFNTIFFEEIARRWALKWDVNGKRKASQELEQFRYVWDIFFSVSDENKSSIPNSLSMIKCKNLVKKHYSND